MNTEIEMGAGSASPGVALLPKDLDFIITRSGSYGARVNVTYRWPRTAGEHKELLVATTTIDTQDLSGLRVELLDGQYFVVNGDSGEGGKVRFSVESESVGYSIVKGIIDAFAPKTKTLDYDNKLNVPRKYWLINDVAEQFAPLIMISCAVLISVSLSGWLLFK